MKNRILNLIAAGVARLLDCRDFRYRVLQYMEKKGATPFKLGMLELDLLEDLGASEAPNWIEKEIRDTVLHTAIPLANLCRDLAKRSASRQMRKNETSPVPKTPAGFRKISKCFRIAH